MITTYTPPWDGSADEDNHVCSVPGCGRKGWDDGVPLTYVTVLILPGEEGYAEVTQAFCNEHLIQMEGALMRLGFVSHNHHGTNSLDDRATCGGYGRCRNPAEYGPELRQP